MPILRMKDLRKMNKKQREEKKKELMIELFKEKGSADLSGSVENPGKIKEIRRTVARIESLKEVSK